MSFQNLKGGDRIRFLRPNGLKLQGGKATPEYRATTAKVQRLLVFEDHVVVNLGGQYGTPYVVDSTNYIGRV